jgi:hypothetical protein
MLPIGCCAKKNNVIIFVYNIMGNIINGTSKQIFGLDKIIEKREEELRKLRQKKIYPIPIRGRGLYGFVRLMNV